MASITLASALEMSGVPRMLLSQKLSECVRGTIRVGVVGSGPSIRAGETHEGSGRGGIGTDFKNIITHHSTVVVRWEE
jgi:hypothetical protein